MLTAFFAANVSTDPGGDVWRKLTYQQFPEYMVWDNKINPGHCDSGTIESSDGCTISLHHIVNCSTFSHSGLWFQGRVHFKMSARSTV